MDGRTRSDGWSVLGYGAWSWSLALEFWYKVELGLWSGAGAGTCLGWLVIVSILAWRLDGVSRQIPVEMQWRVPAPGKSRGRLLGDWCVGGRVEGTGAEVELELIVGRTRATVWHDVSVRTMKGDDGAVDSIGTGMKAAGDCWESVLMDRRGFELEIIGGRVEATGTGMRLMHGG